MILTELICDQILGVTVMFGAGVGTAFLYQTFLWVSRLLIRRKWMSYIVEILFWAVMAGGISKFLYYCAYGQISLHTICAFAGGALLWKICFCDILSNIYAFFEKKIDKNYGKEKTEQSI